MARNIRTSEKKRERAKKRQMKRIRRLMRTQPYVTKSQHTNLEVKVEASYKKISNSKTEVIDSSIGGERITVKYYPKFFLIEDLDKLDSWIINDGMNLSKLTNDCRGEHQVVSLGIWTQQGHNTIHFTPSSQKEAGKQFITNFQWLWNKISTTVKKDFPSIASDLEEIDSNLRPFGLFSFGIINLTQVKKEHRDLNDHNICIVIPTSDFKGGEVIFRYLNLSFVVKKGDMLVFDSRELWHGVAESIYDRRSLVLTTHNSLLKVQKKQ
jgi:CRISPR type IV-associated protein Csf3